jgi:hypothetical protein
VQFSTISIFAIVHIKPTLLVYYLERYLLYRFIYIFIDFYGFCREIQILIHSFSKMLRKGPTTNGPRVLNKMFRSGSIMSSMSYLGLSVSVFWGLLDKSIYLSIDPLNMSMSCVFLREIVSVFAMLCVT